MPQANAQLIKIMQALVSKTESGEIGWDPAPLPSGYLHDGGNWSAAILSESSSGPYRFEMYDENGNPTSELNEHLDSPPGLNDSWRANLAYLYSLAGRANPRQERLLDQVARELGIDQG
jgi:hypothetical protein